MPQRISEAVLGELRAGLVNFKASPLYRQLATPKEEVLARFQPLFSQERIPQITGEEFQSFLLVKNNHHWPLHRYGSRMCSDMKKLREALHALLDDTLPLPDRLNQARERVRGLGKNVASAILLVPHPEKYGVWNNMSEGALREMGIWPAFDRGDSFGERYEKVNQLLLQLCDGLETDFWTLDGLWWFLNQDERRVVSDEDDPVSETDTLEAPRFGLERHLHMFLRDNWERLELSREWVIYSEPDEEEKGYEFPTDIGRIDILAKHKREPRWLVIELKRDNSSDKAIGQLLRYMGWIKRHLAASKEQVQGMIISREADKRLSYALDMVPGIEQRTYEVQFHLKGCPPTGS